MALAFYRLVEFKRLLLRFERIQQRHYGMKLMAYTLINLRAVCGIENLQPDKTQPFLCITGALAAGAQPTTTSLGPPRSPARHGHVPPRRSTRRGVAVRSLDMALGIG
jgi:hypothetical protein